MIEINNYRLSKFDDRNWAIETKTVAKTGKKKGQTIWTSQKYYPKLEHACLALFDLLADGEERWGIVALIEQVQDAKEEIIEALKTVRK